MPFMDDYMRAATNFDSLYMFLGKHSFSCVQFGPIFLVPHKTHVFAESLELLGFEGNALGLRPLVKHRKNHELAPAH